MQEAEEEEEEEKVVEEEKEKEVVGEATQHVKLSRLVDC